MRFAEYLAERQAALKTEAMFCAFGGLRFHPACELAGPIDAAAFEADDSVWHLWDDLGGES